MTIGDAVRYPKFWDKRSPMEYYYGKVEDILSDGTLIIRFLDQPQRIKLKPESVEPDERAN